MKKENKKELKHINRKTLDLPIIEKYIKLTFNKKYYINEYKYGSIIINNIIYNEKSNIVAKFKDYLISDDISEFLKRYYTLIESSIRLPKFYEYYETYSRIYPNYTALPESKYIYKNIHKKQKMIDLQQQMEESEERKKEVLKYKKHKRNNEKDNLVFSTDIYNSIVNESEDLYSLLFGIHKNNDNNEKTQEDFNKIINEINKFESDNMNNLFYENEKNNKNNNLNNNKNLAGKLFSACTKNMIKTSNNKSNNNNLSKYNQKNLFKELQFINSNSHRKAMSTSSGNSTIKKKNKNSNNSLNNIFPYSHKRITSKGEIKDLINKIKIHINLNNENNSLGKICETERIEIKNNKIILQNKKNNKRNRNNNYFLNSKGNFISHTNNNSIIKAKINNKQKLNKNKYKGILSPKINKLKEIEKNDNIINTNDFNIIRGYNNSHSASIKEKLKKISRITKSFITTTNNNFSSIQNTNNNIKYNNYNTINHKTFFNDDKNKSKKNSHSNSKIPSNNKKIIKGIQIKNFNKIFSLNDNLIPKYDSTSRVKINNNKNINNVQKNIFKPKTTRININKKL